jgi:hypothetical protein
VPFTRNLWAAFTLALAGCATVASSDGVIVPTRLTDGIELTASVRGVLAVDAGCLKLRRETGQLQLLVWPEGTSYRAGPPPSVTDSRGSSRALGVPVDIQGGFASSTHAFPGELGTTVRRCGGGPVFLAEGFID